MRVGFRGTGLGRSYGRTCRSFDIDVFMTGLTPSPKRSLLLCCLTSLTAGRVEVVVGTTTLLGLGSSRL
jgi:hypothetical protein